MIMMTRKTRLVKAQVKSRFYYMFWGTATVAVVTGQILVASSYNAMARSMNRWFEETIRIIQPPGYDYDYLPMPSAPRDYPIIQ
jgi:hypothetical protein